MALSPHRALPFSWALALTMPAAPALAQQWVAPPIRTMPGTTIPYPSVYVPPPVHTQPGFIHSQALPTHLVADPTAPGQILGSTPYELLPPPYKKYANEFVAVDELRVINPWNGEVVRSSIQPRQGVYQRPLKREEFYRLIGGDELGQEYAAREGRRNRFIVGGAVSMSLGGILAIVGGTMAMIAAISPTDPKTGKCGPYESMCYSQGTLIGFGVMAGVGTAGLISGMVVLLSGATQKPDPVEPDEARRLAAQYNQGLRQQLGLTPPTTPIPPAGSLAPPPVASDPASPPPGL